MGKLVLPRYVVLTPLKKYTQEQVFTLIYITFNVVTVLESRETSVRADKLLRNGFCVTRYTR